MLKNVLLLLVGYGQFFDRTLALMLSGENTSPRAVSNQPLPQFTPNGSRRTAESISGENNMLQMRRVPEPYSKDMAGICGNSSLSGRTRCPLNVCCSAAGYCGIGPEFCSLTNTAASCQKGYGSCEIISGPSSSCDADLTMHRSIGYVQLGSLSQTELYNGSKPIKEMTNGLSHVFLAFAIIDPQNFTVTYQDWEDERLYKEFVTFSSSRDLQTWIALGGWNFTNPGPTERTWSNLASCSKSRRMFILSLKEFLSRYGFEGVDVDWEYPGTSERSGRAEDTKNLVSLLREMRMELGNDYGISVALPASYWYLRWFDIKEMEKYVDFFSVMTYDLHGIWDNNGAFGNIIAGHTNVSEIQNMILPLWYARIDPMRINFGLAYYGRGYTLSSSSCKTAGCLWTGPSRVASSLMAEGVMTLEEIEELISEKGLEPRLLPEEMMKELSWNDQWIGYDDMETINMKKIWASQNCFGGTSVWSIDQYIKHGGNPSGQSVGSEIQSPTSSASGPSSHGTTKTSSEILSNTIHPKSSVLSSGPSHKATAFDPMSSVCIAATSATTPIPITTKTAMTALSATTASSSTATEVTEAETISLDCFGPGVYSDSVEVSDAVKAVKSFCSGIRDLELSEEPLSGKEATFCITRTQIPCRAMIKFRIKRLGCRDIKIEASGSVANDCERNFKRIVHDCDTSTDKKNGGVLTLGNCVEWRMISHYEFSTDFVH